MGFNRENKIVKLCAKGTELEGAGKPKEAAKKFYEAWDKAQTDEEKYIAAHFVARHQSSIEDKLKWDRIALGFAQQQDNDHSRSSYASLYLNIGKCYDDLGNAALALEHYLLARSYEQQPLH